ncbi:hypothetical protein NL460_28890, partial [Klebsiella pneumoniae]|nr:hypothetical protein [Klebsiella pneumoniae]
CDFMRHQWIASQTSFTFETVMSSSDKIDLLHHARHHGFRTYLYFVCTDSPLINADRVRNRVSEGGHDVPAEKISDRYNRAIANLKA